MLDIGKTISFTMEHTVQSYVMPWQSWAGTWPTLLLNGQTSKHSCPVIRWHLINVQVFGLMQLVRSPQSLICKAMAMATCDDNVDLCEVDELCSGHREGIAGAVHAMKELFEDHHADGYCLWKCMSTVQLWKTASVEYKVLP